MCGSLLTDMAEPQQARRLPSAVRLGESRGRTREAGEVSEVYNPQRAEGQGKQKKMEEKEDKIGKEKYFPRPSRAVGWCKRLNFKLFGGNFEKPWKWT